MDCPYPQLSRRTLRLDNGVTVALHHCPDARRVAIAAGVAAGSAAEPAAWPGLAHFLEHALFLGSVDHPEAGAFADYVHGCGGRYNARTLAGQTLYFLELPARELASGLARLVELLGRPLLDAERLRAEREVIDAEYRARCADPDCQLHAALAGVLHPAHPLARFAAGNRASLDTDDPALHAALRTWHARHYRGGGLRLLIEGPQPLDELERLARTLGAALPGGAPPPAEPGVPLWPAGRGPVELALEQPQALQRMSLWLPLELPASRRDGLLALLRQAAGQPAAGGLAAELRARGWAQRPGIDWLDGGAGEGLLGLRLELAAEGVGREGEIAALCLAWLRRLAVRPALAVAADEWPALQGEQAWRELELAPMERAALWLERWPRQAGGDWRPWPPAATPASLLAALAALDGTRLILQVARVRLTAGEPTPWFAVRRQVRALDGLPRVAAPVWQAPPANPFLAGRAAPAAVAADPALLRPGHAALLLAWQPDDGGDHRLGAELAAAALETCWQQTLHAAARLGHAWQPLPRPGRLRGCLSGPAASLPTVLECLLAELQAGEPGQWRALLRQRRAGEARQLLLRRLLAHPAAQWRLADDELGEPPCETLDAAELRRRLDGFLAAGLRLARPFGAAALPAGFAPLDARASAASRWQGGEHRQHLGLVGGENAVLLRLLAPPGAPEREAAWRLLAVLWQNAFYQALRVEQGLGYALFSRFLAGEEGAELQFGVQSPHADGPRLQQALRAFVGAGGAVLAGLDGGRLEQARQAALDGLAGASRQARLLQACGDWLGGRPAAHAGAVAAALQRLDVAELRRAAAALDAAEWRWLFSR
ncbi:insulinase family protein [Pseudomonas stutzeri]|nr:insulinase family protein [Stutzerimonas stutzeri]